VRIRFTFEVLLLITLITTLFCFFSSFCKERVYMNKLRSCKSLYIPTLLQKDKDNKLARLDDIRLHKLLS
jgi:hypothetical protein